MASRLTPSIQRQLEKLAQMLASEKDTKAAGKTKAAVERDDMSVILQEDAAAAALVAESAPSDCNCSKNTQLLEKLAKEVRRIHELLERIEERKPEIEDLASRAERLARADAALAAIANTATVNEVPLTEALVEQMMQPQLMVAPPPMVLPQASAPQPAFVVTESALQQQAPQPLAAGLPHPSVGGGGGTTFEESTRVVAEGDVATLQQMLETTWRERTKHLYSEQRLAEEPQEPPSAMDVFRDATAELAQDPNVRTKSEFLDRLRLIVKQTAPGILSTLPENPHAHHTMLELWGAEWVS